VDHPQTESDTAQRLFELSTLYEVSRLLQASASADQMAFDVLTAVIGLTGARWGILWMADSEKGVFKPVHTCGLVRSDSETLRLTPHQIEYLSSRTAPLLLPDCDQVPTDRAEWDGESGISGTFQGRQPELLLPLSASGCMYGLIGLGPDFLDRGYETFLQDLLGSVGYLAGLALGRYQGRVTARSDRHSRSLAELRQHHPELVRIVGTGSAVRELCHQICTVAHASCTVLLEGETGTGKQLVAEVIHSIGPRRGGAFIEVDCGSIPENLIESELFGHVRGAFTGAHSDRKGVFELASGGTLFLDEVGNLPFQVQGRLLRVLQERRFRPIGGNRNIEVDVRVIAATNRDLQEAVRDGIFREDLFYRLYVYPVHIPPLRERADDIPLLASDFLSQCAGENSMPVPEITEGFLDRLRDYHFPGNVRELRHIVERILLQSNGANHLEAESLEGVLSRSSAPGPSDEEPFRSPRSVTDSGGDHPLRPAAPYRPSQSRGEWVVEVLKDHRFNIRSAAESLSTFVRSDLMEIPPLTDRSSLTYYLQGECFRLFLEHDGDIDAVGRALSPDDDGLRRIAVLKAQGYIDAARDALKTCGDESKAGTHLLHRFSKLPSTYRNVLLKLAEFLTGNEGSGGGRVLAAPHLSRGGSSRI